MTCFTSPWADYRACGPISDVILYSATLGQQVGQTFAFPKDAYYLLSLKLGLIYHQQLQQ